ncbi:MAG: 1-phosphofructokinase [Propionibacteriaceae bacterium]|jgi:1-phosphofructokinase|nr:1-phosphofructokinase [Propionibacteriaceae bacterium]
MIWTVTLNPSIDHTVWAPDFTEGTVTRAAKERFYPGGKGVNVAIVARRLGLPVRALGFTAGFTGRAFLDMIGAEGVDEDFIEVSPGDTRVNVKLKAARESDINGLGPDIPPDAVELLIGQLGAVRPGDTLVLAGAVPATAPEDVYALLLAKVADRGARCVVDATGPALRHALRHRPFLIKPNAAELADLFGATPTTTDGLADLARQAQGLGARNVLVSRAAEGALLVTEQGDVIEGRSPVGRARNSVGAGDSMVAGFVAGHEATSDVRHALKLGLAAGAATAFSDWLASKELIDRLMKTI